jgi:hypothetical protein
VDAFQVHAEWLTANPVLDVPHLDEAVRGAKPTQDEFFDYLVDTLILSIRARCGKGS